MSKLELQRRADWRPRLTEYLARVAGARFRPGQHDCALFAAGAVEAMTGHDPAAEWRGTYRTLEEGRVVLAGQGYADQVGLVADLFQAVPTSLARVGDLAEVPGEADERALGVFQGAGVYCLRPSGLVLINRLQALGAYRV